MEWNQELCLKLIDAYKNKPILWNPKHPNHYKKVVREGAWEEIAEKMQTDAESCRRKMTILLSNLRRERCRLRRDLKSGKAPEDVYKSTWFAYAPLMQFMNKRNKPLDTSFIDQDKDDCEEEEIDKETAPVLLNTAHLVPPSLGNSNDTVLEIGSSNDITLKLDTSNYTTLEFDSSNDEIPRIHTTSNPTAQRLSANSDSVPRIVTSNRAVPKLETSIHSPPSLFPTSSRKRRKIEDKNLDATLKHLRSRTSGNIDNDDSQDFGNVVAKKLRKYSDATQNVIQREILNIFVNADRGLYDQPLPELMKMSTKYASDYPYYAASESNNAQFSQFQQSQELIVNVDPHHSSRSSSSTINPSSSVPDCLD